MQNISIPIFPLNGAIFFPKSNLPLNIFEKKYLEMVDYSLSKNRLIGMIQSNNQDKLFQIGCVGKINSFNETEDGRYIINLLGKNYYKIKNEITTSKNFRIADIEIKNYHSLKKLSFDKDLLLKKYKNYIQNSNTKIDFSLVKQIANEDLIKFIAMSTPFSIADKQMLLETFCLNDLAKKLISLFDFYPNNKKEEYLIN